MGDPFLKIPLKNLFPRKKPSSRGAAEEAMQRDGLPLTDAELVAQCEREYEAAAEHGGQESLDACFRLAWALVHSPSGPHMERGVELAEALNSHRGSLEQRDLIYLVAVGRFRQKKFVEARKTLKGLMQAHPEFRQAESLLELCDREILKDGLVGLGAGAAIVGGIAAIAIAAMRR